MKNENLKIEVKGDGKEPVKIILLEEEAPKAINLKPVVITGNIDSVTNYLQLREQIVDRDKAVVIFNEQECSIKLLSDPASPLSIDVTGKLSLYPELDSFGINKGKTFQQKELETLIKMSRVFFADREQNASLVMNLRNFKAKVDTTLASEGDSRGNVNKQLTKVVTSDVPLDFVLNIPIFKGLPSSKFVVEICYDITDGGVRFWLESVELAEISKIVLLDAFDKAEKIIKPLSLTIIHS